MKVTPVEDIKLFSRQESCDPCIGNDKKIVTHF